MKKKHCGTISFWKFMFCLMIIIYHGNIFATGNENILFKYGSIGVEFFFIVSGYLLAKKALNETDESDNIGQDTVNYIMRKIKNFFPYIFICWIAGMIVKNVFDTMTLKDNVLAIFDITFMRMAGFKETVINGAVWYISAMLICMLVLYPMIRKFKYNFVYIVSPLIVLLVGGWLNQNYGSLRVPDKWIGFAYKGLLRAFFELNLGCIIYVLSKKMEKVEFNNFGRFLITTVEVACLLIPFLVSSLINEATKYDYMVLFILSIGVCLAFTEKSYGSKIFNNKFIYFLEKISLPMYISHTWIRTIINEAIVLHTLSYYQKIILFVIVTIFISILMYYLVEFLKKKEYFIPKLKKAILVR